MQKEKPSVDSSGMRTPKSLVTSSSSTEPLKEHWDARLPEFWQFLKLGERLDCVSQLQERNLRYSQVPEILD